MVNVHKSSCEVIFIPVRFTNIHRTLNFIKIRPVGAELLHQNTRTDGPWDRHDKNNHSQDEAQTALFKDPVRTAL